MGRDWYWGGKTGTTAKKEDNIRETPGCMSGVLHLFDFHQFQFPISQPPCFKPNSIPQEDPTFSKGSEAPRNSLESDHEDKQQQQQQQQQVVHFPIEGIRVLSKAAMKKEGGGADELSSDSCSSPGPKTPSLVARLMGLDLLPDAHSSSSSPSSSVRRQREEKQIQSKSNQHKSRSKYLIDSEILGSRSLPDTPRVSSSSRRSDVDARFSLQIQRDNIVEMDYFSQEKPKRRDWILKDEEENRSPGHYARQIVKQVKESVSRRVGSDITNTHHHNNSSSNRFKTKEVEEVVLLKSKKPKRLTKIGEESNSSKQSSLNSPRLRLCEENKSAEKVEQISLNPKPCPSTQPVPVSISAETKPTKAKQKPKSQPLPHHQTIEKCKKPSCERFTQRKEVGVVRGSKQEKKCKNTKGTTESSSPSTSSSTSLHHPHVQTSEPISCEGGLSSSKSRVCSSLNNPTNFADEIRYTSQILKCTGVDTHSLISLANAKWFSPSHPLDPSIFHSLEIHHHHYEGTLKERCNRRLIFNLVDELLVKLLKPYLNMKPWRETWRGEDVFTAKRQMRGEELLQRLSKEMMESPLSNCQTLEDIDNLIEKDFVIDSKLSNGLPVFEESELIVFEIEQDILDTLIHETANGFMQQQQQQQHQQQRNQRQKLCVTDNQITWAFT